MASSEVITTTITDPSVIDSYNRGPITTAFDHPATCTATLTHLTTGSTDLFFGNWGGEVDTSCYPTGTKPPSELVTGDWGSYYYSPAICPLGWTTVTTFESDIPGWNTWEFVTLNAETTAALCCPSEYSYFERGHQCSSTITAEQTILLHRPTRSGTDWVYYTPITTSYTKATYAVGDGVPIWWQSSDAEVLASASTMAPTNRVTAGTSPTSTTAVSSDSSGLSTGAKIGIGIGIPLAVITGLVMGFFLGVQRQKRQEINKSEAKHVGGYVTGSVHEVDGTTAYELPNGDIDNRHELPGVVRQ